MDRFAIFVDVGYVVAAAAELLTGSAERHLVTCDYGPLMRSLVTETSRDSGGLPLLRTYWYDASLTGQPEHDQVTVADLPGVRLRLGRLVRGEQKGVDSRIVRDLIVLARDRAMTAAFLLAGDEDICEGVAEAQDHGVRVTLLGVPGVNQSRLLMQQADDQRVMPEKFWRAHFRKVEQPRELPLDPGQVAAPGRIVEMPLPTQPLRPGSVNEAMREAFNAATARSESPPGWLRLRAEEMVTLERKVQEAGAEFARELREEQTPVEREKMLKLTGWQVPRELDVRLLRFAEQHVGIQLWERPELKPHVRNGFWDEYRKEG